MNNTMQQNIIKELGLDRLPQTEIEEILLRVGKIIFQSVMIRVLEELDDSVKDEFDALLSQKPDDQEAVLQFLRSKLPNLDDIVNEEVQKFKEESADFMKSVKQG